MTTVNDDPIKILILEDDEMDAEIIQRLLIKSYSGSFFKVVMTKEDFIRALDDYKPDVILSDNAMPQFSASEALQIVKQIFPEIPFILVTGTVSEEFAVAVIKAGADDYLLKDRLARLPAAMESALKQKQTEKDKMAAANSLKKNERQFRALVEHNDGIIAMVDENLFPVYYSNGGEKLTGFTLEERMRVNDLEQIHPGDIAMFNVAFAEVKANPGKAVTIQLRMKHKEGHYIFCETTYTNLLYDPNVSAIVVNSRDISVRKKAEEDIFKANRLYRFISQVNEMIVHASDEVMLFAEACRIAVDAGSFKMAWIGMIDENSNKLIPVANAGDDNEYLSFFTTISESKNSLPKETAIGQGDYSICNDVENSAQLLPWKKDALERGYYSYISLPIKKFGKTIGSYAFYAAVKNYFDADEIKLLQEVTNNVGFALELIDKEKLRKISEEKLLVSNCELRSLSTHLQTVREEERMHIAREIHDELGQQLTGLKMDLALLHSKIQHKDEATEEKIKEIQVLLDNTVVSVRRISTNLRPAILDDLGLIPALEWLSRETEKRSEIKVRFTCNMQNFELPFNIITGLFRIYQEVLTNAVRYSNAHIINASLHIFDNNITLQVSDDGIGMENNARNKKTFGLIGIKERVFLMQGSIEIKSISGQGTIIFVSIPHEISL